MAKIATLPFLITTGASATLTKASDKIEYRWSFLGCSVHFPQGCGSDLKVYFKTSTEDGNDTTSISGVVNLLDSAALPSLWSNAPYVQSNNGVAPISIIHSKDVFSENNYLNVTMVNSGSASYTAQIYVELIELEN